MNNKNDAPASMGSACLKKAIGQITLDHLPQLLPRPLHATDHTGQRRGAMTAIAWYRHGGPGKATQWLCRCDCGLYEYRRPGTWVCKPFPEDRCAVCERAKGPNARETAAQRLQQWLKGLRDLGLSEAEIARIREPGMQVQTRGSTAAQIRAQLAGEKHRE